MKVNSVQNLGFRGIYTVYGSRGKMLRLQNILSSNEARDMNVGYINATDTFEHIDTIRHLDQIKYRNTAQDGGMVGFIFTDDDIEEFDLIDKMSEDTAHDLTFKTDKAIDLDKENIPNIL